MVKSKRLLKVLEYVEPVDVVADIGSDHGYFTEMLIESGKAKKVIATDISSASLDKTRLLIAKLNIEKKVETRVGDGLLVLKPDEVNIAVIAGMGGHEIAKILGSSNRKDNIKNFVLQPVQNAIDLRKWLVNNGYNIDLDECVEEAGKFYDVIKVRKVFVAKRLRYKEYMFGKTNVKNKELTLDFVGKLNYEKNRYKDILVNHALTEQRDKDVKKYLKTIDKLLKKSNKER